MINLGEVKHLLINSDVLLSLHIYLNKMELRELIHPWSPQKYIIWLDRLLRMNACAKRLSVFRFHLQLQQLYKPGELSLKQEHFSSCCSFTDSPSSHYKIRSFVWRQWQILRPAPHSSCMQHSHGGHLIRLTSASAPCTECATQNLGESIISQLALPWHLQPPIYFSLVVSFPFISLASPTKRKFIFSFFTNSTY